LKGRIEFTAVSSHKRLAEEVQETLQLVPRLPDLAPCAGLRPVHVAVIMDGNGRWASKRGLPRVAGHREGARAVRRTIQAAIEADIQWLTLYAFSSENWRRPAAEVRDLTGLLRHYLRSEVEELHRNGVKLRIIGDRGRFGADLCASMSEAEQRTSGNTRLNLIVALSYGARTELAAAARAVAEAAACGKLDPALLDETVFEQFLSTAGMPDPDLVIRTSGEQRLSNFLLWQAAYAELVFQDVLWPDYGKAFFAEALDAFCRRERRFGR
jgi:undecaprenyl diphosphate synthase